MSIEAQILELFEKLSEPARHSLLQDLNSMDVSETILIEDAPILSCPHCESKLFVRNGKRGDLQKYQCKSCCKIFTSRTGTPFHKIKKLDKFEAYKALMFDGYLPLKKMAKAIGISIQTAFDWRHKILSGMSNNSEKFEGITEIDDIWFLYSQKGRKGLDYSRKRGGSKRAGDNDFQAKLLITSDRKPNTVISLIRVGRIKKSDIQRKISGKFSDNCTLVSDKHRSISSFAKSEGLEHISFKASEHTAGGEWHVQNVNNMASRLKSIINHSLRGVSTKYLQSYANWFNLKSSGLSDIEMDEVILKSKNAWNIHKNREGIYKRFIENFSRRTYRCPVKRKFKSQLDPDILLKLQYV
jgi:transposase-like protein